MSINQLTAVFGVFFSIVFQVNAQNISGRILDESTDLPVANALIFLHELDKSTLTSDEGAFLFENINKGVYHLHISCLGYESITLDAASGTVIPDLKLKPTLLELKEALVEDSFLKSELKNRSLNIEQLNQEDIFNNASSNFSENLAQLPGIRTISVGPGIAKPVIRGLSGNRVIVNQLGIKQEGQQWGNDHGLEIDPFSVDRVELIKGPASLLYGSDGLGGVINILPSPISAPHTWKVQVAESWRSNDASLGTALKADMRLKSIYWGVRASLREYADFQVPADSFTYLNETLAVVDGRLKNTAGRELSYAANAGIVKSWGYLRVTASSFEQKTGLFPGIFEIPTEEELSSDGDLRNIDLPRQEVTHRKIAANFNKILDGGWLEADLGYQSNNRKELTHPHGHDEEEEEGHADEELPDSDEALNLSLQSYSATVRRHWNSLLNWKSVWGVSASFNDNISAGWEFLIPDYQVFQAGSFFTAERRFEERLVFNWGLRVDFGSIKTGRFTEEVHDENEEVVAERVLTPGSDNTYWNYSAGMGIAFDLNIQNHLKLNIGKSFRLPSAAELASNGVHHGTFRHEMGNIDLKAEQGYQLDMLYRYSTKRLLLNFSPYFNYFDGFIYQKATGIASFLPEADQIYEYAQSNAVFTGAELFVDIHPIEQLHLELGSDLVYSYNLDNSQSLPFTPPVRNRVSLKWGAKSESPFDWMAGCTLNQVFRQNWVDEEESTTPGYESMDVFFNLKASVKSQKISFQIRMNNVFNANYLDHLSRYRILNLPAQGRNLILSLSIPLEGKLKQK